ncbi:MAG: polysaccharide deacetylase family protein [Nocardiopsaceae bacterium]|nr:polysaccharide deacetylase family protein [Nocardiopsaceae bacterium]
MIYGREAVSSNALLGFAPEARVLIVNADDFGMYGAVNAAVVESIDHGIASSCSLMVPCPGAKRAIQLLKLRPDISFGIHLTLICDTVRDRWGPMAPKSRVPSLLNEAGELFPPAEVGRLLAQARLDEVEVEFRAQIDAVVGLGLRATHLDWHCMADGGRGDIFDLTVALAKEYGLAVRAWLEPGGRKLRQLGLPVVDNPFLDSFSLEADGKAARYAELVRDLPAGLTEWAVHPGLGDRVAQGIEPDGWQNRRSDYEFLTSSVARELVEQEGIDVIDYSAIQHAWSQLSATPWSNEAPGILGR